MIFHVVFLWLQVKRLFLAASMLYLLQGEVAEAQFKQEKQVKHVNPDVRSHAVIVADIDSGKVYFERSADEQRPIASLSKLMASYVLYEHCQFNLDRLHTMSIANREAAKGGDKTKLTTGWSFSIDDLFHAALMRSDNRALPALGEACGLTVKQVGELMTKKAGQMGLKLSEFREPTGLSEHNVSTAREMLKVLQTAIEVPYLAEVMKKRKHTITAVRDEWKRRIVIRNTDRLIGSDLFEPLGSKTGYTDKARYCFAFAGQLSPSHRLGIILLGAEGKLTRFADVKRIVGWFRKNVLRGTTLEAQIKKEQTTEHEPIDPPSP